MVQACVAAHSAGGQVAGAAPSGKGRGRAGVNMWLRRGRRAYNRHCAQSRQWARRHVQ